MTPASPVASPDDSAPPRWSWRPNSLRGRLVLWYALILGVVLVVFCAVLYTMVLAIEIEEEESGIEDEAAEQELLTELLIGALGVGLPLSLGIAVGGGLLVARRALRPI